MGEIGSLEVPETLHALVAARLDGLPAEERRLLGDAAVLGKTFTPGALASLTGMDQGNLEVLLGGLVRQEVLGLQSDSRSPEHGQYGFLQDMLRHVAYETLPKRERRAKHLAAAEHLSSAIGEDEVVEVIASHLLEAYRLDPDADDAGALRAKAQAALDGAGERAASLGASAEAQRYFEQAAELATDAAGQGAALSRAGEMASGSGSIERAAALFEQAIGRYEEVGDTHAAARVASWLGMVEQVSGHPDRAIERMERAFVAIGDDEADSDLALLLNRLAAAHWFAGNAERSAELTERAIDVAEALMLPEQLARGWLNRARLVSPRRPQEARGLYHLALETSVANGDLIQAITAHFNLSDLALQRDRYVESLGHLERGLEITRTLGRRGNEWFALSESSYALTMLGRWDEAVARHAEIPEEQIGHHSDLASPLSGVLVVHLHRGELADAQRLLARYDELAKTGDVQVKGAYRCATAAVRLAERNPSDALVAGEEASRRGLSSASRRRMSSWPSCALSTRRSRSATGTRRRSCSRSSRSCRSACSPRSSPPRRTVSADGSPATIQAPTASSSRRLPACASSNCPSISRLCCSSTVSGSLPRPGPATRNRSSPRLTRRSSGSGRLRGSNGRTGTLGPRRSLRKPEHGSTPLRSATTLRPREFRAHASSGARKDPQRRRRRPPRDGKDLSR